MVTMLEDCPFDYRETKNGLVHVSIQGRMIMTLKGKAASKFLAKCDGATEAEAQLAMAKVTGHFKHGNERESKNRRR